MRREPLLLTLLVIVTYGMLVPWLGFGGDEWNFISFALMPTWATGKRLPRSQKMPKKSAKAWHHRFALFGEKSSRMHRTPPEKESTFTQVKKMLNCAP